MNTPLTRSQFSLAISQGRGKALMHAKQFGIKGVTDLVLEACLNTPPLADSLFEANWLFTFFKDSPHYESISEEFLNRVTKTGRISDDDYFLCVQYCNITALIAEQGSKRAEKILRDFVLNQPLGKHLDWCGVAALHSLRNKEDAILIAQRTGKSLRRYSESQDIGDFYCLRDLYRYHKSFENTLFEMAQNDEDIKIYLEAFQNANKKEENIWKDEQDRKSWQQKMQEQYPFENLLTMAYRYDDRAWCRMVHARPWTDNELRTVTKYILSGKDHLILCRLMFIFSFKPLPEFDPAFFRFAYSSNSEIRSSGLRLLSINHDKRVGYFGREILADLDYVRKNPEVFGIFNIHFRAGDEIKIISVLENLGATPERIYNLPLYPEYSLNDSSGLSRLLIWLYEHQPCPGYRADLTLRMLNHKAFTKELATECLYDAERSTRETAKVFLEK